MIFHRNSANPDGYDPFPSGYDFINNPPANGDTGAAAMFDGKKSGGPNAGTYFKAFGEDAVAQYYNRGMNALSVNTDTLDNYLRQPLALPARTDTFTGGVSGDASRALPASPAVYLGTSGGDTITQTVGSLFTIVDLNGDPILNVASGARIVAASITSTSGGDVIGAGFSSGTITLVFNHTIPAGQTYRIFYGIKGNLAFQTPDVLLRQIQPDSFAGFVSDFVQQVSRPGTLGNTVTALVATSVRTPDGTRRPKVAVMNIDVDPADGGFTTRALQVRMRADTGSARVLAAFNDDPTASVIPGTTGSLQMAPGTIFDFVSTAAFRDVNTAGAAPANITEFLPLTSGNTTNGDQFIRLADQLPSAVSLTPPPSILRSLNARPYISVGNGTSTFGDFNGAGGLEAAVAFFIASPATVGKIVVKGGTYTWTTAYVTSAALLAIEGSDEGSVTINTSSSSLLLNSSGMVSLKNLKFVRSSGGFGGVTVSANSGAGKALFMESVSWTDLQTLVRNPDAGEDTVCIYAKRCRFVSTTSGNPTAFVLQADNGVSHSGMLFEDCVWVQVAETQPFKIACTGISTVTTVSNLYFNRCTYTLGVTTVSGGHHTTNTGVVEISPLGKQFLNVTDITFRDCNVTAGAGSAATSASILAFIHPLPKNTTDPETNIAIVGRVSILGGTWDAGAQASALSPLFISAQQVIGDGALFLNTAAQGAGAAPSEAGVVLAATNSAAIPSTALWGAFTFSVGLTSLFVAGLAHVFPVDSGVRLNRLRFSRLQQFGACDCRVDLPSTLNAGSDQSFPSSRLQDLSFYNYQPATISGSTPEHRLYINVAFDAFAATNESVNAVIDQIMMRGATGGEAESWADNISGGLVGIAPMNGLLCRRIRLANFVPASGSADNGFYLRYGEGLDTYQMAFEDCSAVACQNGFYVPRGSGTNNSLDQFRISGGNFSSNAVGITIIPDFLGYVVIDRVRAALNTNNGITVAPLRWSVNNTITPWLLLSGNDLSQNNSATTGVGASILCSNGGDSPIGEIRGNRVVNSSGSLGGIQIQSGAGAALPGSAAPGVGVFVYGAETGRGTSPAISFSNATAMLYNEANLITP